MRHQLLIALLLCCTGCTAPAQSQGPTWREWLRAGAPVDPNLITIETALIELPLGDSYLCHEVWHDSDELAVGLDLRDALQENGLRVGQLVGSPPVGFQTLLLSPRCCANPEGLIVPTGKTIPQYLGPVRAHSAFTVVLESGKTELEADGVRFGFDVVATLTNDGRTRLAFTPKVETSESLLPYRASPEDATWVYRIERPSRNLPQLGWSVTLAPGQYVVVGCRPDKAGTFGAAAFMQEDGQTPVQRLLVIRTNRATSVAGELGSDEWVRAGPTRPLALQAAQPAFQRSNR